LCFCVDDYSTLRSSMRMRTVAKQQHSYNIITRNIGFVLIIILTVASTTISPTCYCSSFILNNNNNNNNNNNIVTGIGGSTRKNRSTINSKIDYYVNNANTHNVDILITTKTTKLFADNMSSSSITPSTDNNDNDNDNSIDNDTSNSRCGIDYPELVVFDLDACFWDQEMYQMSTIPTNENIVMGKLLLEANGVIVAEKQEAVGREDGVIGVYSGRSKISLHEGSLIALQEHLQGIKYPGMKICFASSADTPKAEKIGRATLQLLEIIPGVTVWDIVYKRDWNSIDINQIGRQPPLLSSNKAKSHFPNLRKATGIRYDKMLFFDDW
jgi:hypothetical protein